jgi:two-component system, OmpR family, sensor histidine kinase KdpD
MSPRALSPLLLRSSRPSWALGVAVALAGIAIETLAIYPLAHVANVVSLGVVYLIAVVGVATYWGILLGFATALASAAAFNFFHLPPVGRLTLADSRNWAALAAFLVVAAATGVVAELARTRAAEAEERRREADLATEMARLLLGGLELDDALAVAAQRLAVAIGAASAAIEVGAVAGDERREAFPLRRPGDGDEQIGTLVLPAAVALDDRERIRLRIVPALQSVLAAALSRAELESELVETAALRRSDEMKTAILRSVSHDLRTPLTAIMTAAASLDPEHADGEEVGEAREVVLEAATRLASLVEKLLDLSRLQSGAGAQHVSAYSLEDVLAEAIEHVAGAGERPRLSLDELPLLYGDASQLERAFANLIENALRYGRGRPVLVRARVVGERVRVRIIDQGPGIRAGELERIFLPFYRSADNAAGHQGSGLGLAIAKGFIEANGGRISVESLPGQGTSLIVELPLSLAAAPEPAPA